MRKIIGFIGWWGALIGGFVIFFNSNIEYRGSANDSFSSSLTKILCLCIPIVLLWLVSGVMRRLFFLSPKRIERIGFGKCLLKIIFCCRFFFSIVFFLAVSALPALIQEDKLILVVIVDIFVIIVGFTLVRATCPRCGCLYVKDGTDYDDDLHIDIGDDSANMYRYATDYLHCPICGKTAIRTDKRKAGTIHYK